MAGTVMNQYIINDKIIAELIDYSNAEDAEACIRNIIDTKVRSHPYQSERDKMLDDIVGMFDNGNYNGVTVKQMITGKFKEIELREQISHETPQPKMF
jgi:hypothetical protein